MAQYLESSSLSAAFLRIDDSSLPPTPIDLLPKGIQ